MTTPDVSWADLRCPSCGGQTYGPVGNTVCEMGHERVRMVARTDGELDWCGQVAPEAAAAKGVRPCAAPEGHRGKHAWWSLGASTLFFYGDDGAVRAQALLRHAQTDFTQQEAAALWQFLEFLASKRAADRTHNAGAAE